MLGRLLAALGASLVALVFVTGTGTAAVATAAGCAHPCGGESQTIGQTSRPDPEPCIRDVGCGGGVALGTGVAVAAVVLLASGAAALSRGVWRRLRAVSGLLVGRLPPGGLFRPPRFVLDI